MLDNKNQNLFAISTRGICCGLLATGLLIQSGISPVYAAASGHSIINSTNTPTILSDSEIQALHLRICSLYANTQDEAENIFINNHEITLDIGGTFQLELTNTDGKKLSGAQLFVKYRIPYDELVTVDDYNLQDGACTVTNDGFVTAIKAGTTEIWAKYGDALYRCVVNVTPAGETALSKKVVEIADKFRHLSDVDKVMAVHDYLIDHIEYSNPHIRSFAYGALIEGKAVCQGYAQSLAMILNRLNVECHTIVAMTKGSNPVLHEWVRVKLDGEWYYIDLTWDDTPWAEDKNYKYFLINTDMISRDHETGYSLAGGPEADGSKYLYYAYKKQGIFAETKDDIDKIIKDQINATNQSYTTVKIAVPASVPDYEIHGAIRRIAGSQATLKELNDIKNTSGSYHHYGFNVGFIKTVPSVDTEFTEIRPINSAGGTTTGLELTFSSDIGELTPFNVKVDGVHISDIRKTGVGVYNLTFNDLLSKTDTDLTVTVNKRGYNIANNEKTVHISLVKEQVPAVSFEAVGLKEGRLTNVEPGLKYSVGDGIWHDITSTSPVDVTTVYNTPISIVRKSTGEGRLDSEPQFIYPIKTREPYDIQAVNCSTNNSNDGKLLYLNRQMEYRKSGDSIWTSVTGKEVTGLSLGKYEVRYKAKGLNLASSEITVNINAGLTNIKPARPHTPIFRPDVNTGAGSPSGDNSGSADGGSSAGDIGGSTGGGGGSSSSGGFAGGGGFASGGGSAGGGGSSSSGGFAGGGSAGGPSGDIASADTEVNNSKVENAKTENIQNKESENIVTDVKNNNITKASKNAVNLSKSALEEIVNSELKALEVISNKVKLSFEIAAIRTLNSLADSEIEIKAVKINNKGLPSKAKKLIGKHPIYNLQVSDKGGSKIAALGKGRVTVSIPYKLGKTEKSKNIIVYYIDKKGNVKKLSNAVYNSKSKTVTFTTNQLARFAIACKIK